MGLAGAIGALLTGTHRLDTRHHPLHPVAPSSAGRPATRPYYIVSNIDHGDARSSTNVTPPHALHPEPSRPSTLDGIEHHVVVLSGVDRGLGAEGCETTEREREGHADHVIVACS